MRKAQSYRAPLTGCDCSGQWRRCRLDIEGFLYCMAWKDMSITRSRPWWDVHGNSKSQLHKARMKLRESLKTSRAEKATKQYWGEMKYELRAV